ncbi:MAG: hypothetical protein ABI443_00580, partial [Chthoniobacterales bacterium]
YSIVVVLIRLCCLHSLLAVFNLVAFMAVNGFQKTALPLNSLGMTATMLVSIVVIWLAAPWLAFFITKGYNVPFQVGPLKLYDCHCLLLIGVGIYFVGSSAGAVGHWIYVTFGGLVMHVTLNDQEVAFARHAQYFQVIQPGIQFLFGLVLLFQNQRIARLLCGKMPQRVVGE